MNRVVVRVSPSRIGCVLVGPVAVGLGLLGCALGYVEIGAMLARPITAAEATEALQLYESYRLSWDAQAELRARGLARPDAELGRRWVSGIQAIRAMSVVAVSHRPSLLWPISRRTRCVTRMEIERPGPMGAPVRLVRYFRMDCGWLAYPRIVWETGAWGYRVPL
jgi:hypothetical protein